MEATESSEFRLRFNCSQPLTVAHCPLASTVKVAHSTLGEQHASSCPEPIPCEVIGTKHSTGSGFKPLEVARRLRAESGIGRSGSPGADPLKDFELLFPLVDPSSPGLPVALLRGYLSRCKRCDHVFLKCRVNTHLCPVPGKD